MQVGLPASWKPLLVGKLSVGYYNFTMVHVPTLDGQMTRTSVRAHVVALACRLLRMVGALRKVHTSRLGGHTFQTQAGHTAPVVQRPVAMRSYVGSLQLQRIAPEFCSSLLLLLGRLLTPHIA